MPADWREFWDRPNNIYAGQRHLRAHYDRLLCDLRPHLPTRPGAAILDYGCGEALAAEALADSVERLSLYDASLRVRKRLAERFAGNPKVVVCHDPDLHGIADASVDLALLISVVQYLDRAALRSVLAAIRRVVHPEGCLIVADVIEPGTSLSRDIARRLKFAASGGFLLDEVAALAGLYFSDYRAIRRSAGFAAYEPQAFASLLGAAGFEAEPSSRNIGPLPHRRAFLARPKETAASAHNVMTRPSKAGSTPSGSRAAKFP